MTEQEKVAADVAQPPQPGVIEPRAYDLTSQAELRRLLREVRGYLHTCRGEHHGTDFAGRQFAIAALQELIGWHLTAVPPS